MFDAQLRNINQQEAETRINKSVSKPIFSSFCQ